MKTYTVSTTVNNANSTVIEDDVGRDIKVKSIQFSFYDPSGATTQQPKVHISVNDRKITERPVYPAVFDFSKNDRELFELTRGDNLTIEVSNLDNTITQQIDITFIGE